MKFDSHAVYSAVSTLWYQGAKRATKYVSPDYVVSAHRVGKPDRRGKSVPIMLKIGKPNHAERAFIKACRKAGEPFPVRRVQVKFPSKVKR